MKTFMAWVFAVISILLGIIPFVVGFIAAPIMLGFNAGVEANELLNNKTDEIVKNIGKKR